MTDGDYYATKAAFQNRLGITVSATGTLPTEAMLDQWYKEAYAMINAYWGVTSKQSGTARVAAAEVVSLLYAVKMLNAIRKIKRSENDALDSIAGFEIVPVLSAKERGILAEACTADGSVAYTYNMHTGERVA